MHDEDSGETVIIRCPYCGSEDDCLHLLAVFDMTFGECHGGYCFAKIPSLISLIEGAFLAALQGEDREDIAWDDYLLDGIWQEALSEFSPGDQVVHLSSNILPLLTELLEGAGADPCDGSLVDDGGPGMTSSVELLYAEKPQQVFDRAAKNLQLLLSSNL